MRSRGTFGLTVHAFDRPFICGGVQPTQKRPPPTQPWFIIVQVHRDEKISRGAKIHHHPSQISRQKCLPANHIFIFTRPRSQRCVYGTLPFSGRIRTFCADPIRCNTLVNGMTKPDLRQLFLFYSHCPHQQDYDALYKSGQHVRPPDFACRSSTGRNRCAELRRRAGGRTRGEGK